MPQTEEKMSHKWMILIAALGGVTGCSVEEVPVEPKPENASPEAPEKTAASSEDEIAIDPFYLAIEAERWNVMLENALGLKNDVLASELEDDRLRAHRALNDGITNLLDLRDQVCRDGLVDPETCYSLEIPDWAFRWEEELPSLDVLQERSDWLGEAIQPFVSAVCSTDEDGMLPDACRVE